MVAMRQVYQNLEPLQGNLAKPYATKAEESTVPTVLTTTRKSVFRVKRPKSAAARPLVKLETSHLFGKMVGGKVYASAVDLKEVVTIQKKGKILTMAHRIRMI